MGKISQCDCFFTSDFFKVNFQKKIFIKVLVIFLLWCCIGKTASAQIAAWDFTGQNTIATFSATTFNANLNSANGANNITRGLSAVASTGINSFRTTGFKNDGIALSNTDYFQITLLAVSGYNLSLFSIDAQLNGTSTYADSTGVSNQFAYSLDGTNFVFIGSPVTVIGQPRSLPQINLSGIAALQNVPSGTIITIRYYASGQTISGGWGLFSPLAGTNGLAIGGSISASNAVSKPSFVGVPSNGTTGQSISAFSVEVRKPDNSLDNTFSGNITLSKASGPGSINGTLSVTAISGVATFNDIGFNQAGDYKITAVATSISAATSGTITVTESSASTDYFRSNVSNGDWQSLSSWQSSEDNINWFPAAIIPGNSSRGITIRKGQTIKLAADVVTKLLTIEAGGTLSNTNLSGGYLLTITDDGTAEPDFIIYGTYVLFGKIPVFSSGATAVVFNNGIVRADENTGASENFASSGNVLFKTGAVFEWNNTNGFNTSAVTYFPNSVSDIPIFRISKTTPALGTTKFTTFNGILEINSNTSFTGTGDKIFRDGLTGISTLTLEASTARYDIMSAAAILGGSLRLITNNILHFGNGILIPATAAVSVTGTGSLKNESGIFLVNGTIDISDIKLTNTNGTVTVNGIIKTSKTEGLFGSGCNIPSGILNINSGSTIEYNGADQQITSSTVLKSSYYNIVFSGSGIKTPNSGIDVNSNGSVKITGEAIVDASSKNIGLETTNNTRFIMDGGRLILGTSSNVPLPLMQGAYNISGGIIEFNHSDNLTQTIRTNSYQNIEVSGNNVGNSSGNITLNTNGTFTVKTKGIFEINANSITCPSGGAIVKIENGAIFRTGNNQGFNGFATTSNFKYSSIHSNITNIQLDAGSTVEYSGNIDQPITTANKLIYNNIIFSGSGRKIAPSDELIVEGNISKSGTSNFEHNSGTVILNGKAEQNISGGMEIFNNLTNNNTVGVNINNDIGIYKTFSLGAKSKTILNTGNIHLKSDKNNTANVAAIPINAEIIYKTGLFIAERFVSEHPKSWQFLSACTKEQTIKDSWQEGNISGGNIKPGYGTQITSNLANAIDLGFDKFSVNPSMKTYNSLINNWVGVPNTKDMLINNSAGYMIFIRGDRSVVNIDQPAVATTLRTKGKLYSPGTEAPASLNITANTFTSVGNPYASAINFDKIIKSEGIDQSYYIWDPKLTSGQSSSYGFGGYRTISGNSVVPATGKFSDENNFPMIQSGQAFFVHSSKAGIITFDENCKISENTSIFRPQSEFFKQDAQLRGNLYVLNNNEAVLIDGILTQFHSNYSNKIDEWDAIKISNSSENISIASNGKSISIERRQRPYVNDTIFYHLGGLLQRQYQLEIIASRFEQYGMDLFLEDKFLQTKTILNSSGSTVINFTVNNSSASSTKDRFHILFKAAGGPVPVTFSAIKAYSQNKNIMIEWKTENENGISNYTIEKSVDGNSFVFESIQPAKNGPSNNYNWLDINPYIGYNYYRIKSMSKNGEEKYSQIVHVNNPNDIKPIFVFPNPLVDAVINLQMKNQPAGRYIVRVTNYIGGVIIVKQVNHHPGSGFEAVILPGVIPHGIYHVEVISPTGKKTILRIKN